ncbi:MAG TPA: hypothetical protein VFG30_30760 [Polyangiales bacterium]|nr:hypothetical protein [Polyangiales bacterium]
MFQVTGAGSSVLSLALVSLSLLSCSNESGPDSAVQAQVLALEGDAGSSVDSGGGGEADAAAPVCVPRDATCDALDDDCDGRFDEDVAARCVFGRVALVCVGGQIVNQSCDDGDPCTVDSCDVRGCHHVAIVCNDDNPCTVDQCNPSGACTFEPALNTACDDGDACTSGDACTASGSCSAGTPVDPDDGNPCTVDACDPSTGMSHVADVGASCDDANLCSENDVCTAAGMCEGAPRPDVADDDPCTADACDPATGNVTHTIVPAGASCSDGDVCNGDDTCELYPVREFTVEAHTTFYRADNGDDVRPPTIIKLADVGLRPGLQLHIYTVGTYDSPMIPKASVIFSSDSNLLPRTELHRVTGAIQSNGPSSFSANTFFDNQTTDIAEDFRVDNNEVVVQIPAGAQYVFISNFDSYYGDNAGSLTMKMQAEGLACTAGSNPLSVDDANVCTADACDSISGVSHEPVSDGVSCTVASAPGACVEGLCIECSEDPEACQLGPE